MHLLIPFAAALSEQAALTVRELALPNLARLLSVLAPGSRDSADEYSLSPPHERALAAAWGWRPGIDAAAHAGGPAATPAADDGLLPFAARLAAADGIAVADQAWGLLTPVHWRVSRDHITLADPAALALSAADSQAFLDAIRPLFESEGWTLRFGAAERWYVAHESLAELPAASLDRVIGRNVDLCSARAARHGCCAGCRTRCRCCCTSTR